MNEKIDVWMERAVVVLGVIGYTGLIVSIIYFIIELLKAG
jgi:hypothetical protein